MNLRPLLVVGGLIVLAMLGLSAWAWPQIPDGTLVPVHWDAAGEADAYGPKWLALLGIPAVSALIVGVLVLLPRLEPRRANLERSSSAYVGIGIAVCAFLGVVHLAAVLAALGSDGRLPSIAMIGAGLLFVAVGNYLGKTRSSWFFGIRTPWTLNSERSWTRTHRIGGIAFIVVGLAVIAATLLLGDEWALWLMLGSLFTMLIGLFGYSYLVWRDDPQRRHAAR